MPGPVHELVKLDELRNRLKRNSSTTPHASISKPDPTFVVLHKGETERGHTPNTFPFPTQEKMILTGLEPLTQTKVDTLALFLFHAPKEMKIVTSFNPPEMKEFEGGEKLLAKFKSKS